MKKGRPKLAVTRCRQLNIGLTEAEHDTVLRRAAALGMRPVDYGRLRVLGQATRTTLADSVGQHHLDPLFRNALSRIGSNLNQIARQMNALRMALPPDLDPLLQELREILRNGWRQ